MARMIPPVIDPGNPSPGEAEVFCRLRDDPLTKSWTVLHSLDIARHVRQTVGEADFVVVIPNKAVVCIEVKGHKRVRRAEGAWYLGGSTQPDYRGPFKQAREAMESIRADATVRRPDLNDIPFTWAVIFPFVAAVDQIKPNEWLPWQLVTSTDLAGSSIGEILANIAESERSRLRKVASAKWFNPSGSAPTSKQCEALIGALRPDFELCETPSSIRYRREAELRRYTEEQFIGLDAMESNDRVIFEGPAGTGKTVLALEGARREAIRERRVLLLCYNKLLRDELAGEAKSFGVPLDVRTVDSLLLEVAGSRVPPGGGSNAFWKTELPAAALDVLLRRDSPAEYGTLIVDEAQDVLQTQYLDVLDLILEGGWAAGRWRIFGDFVNQAIYGNPDLGLADLSARAPTTPSYSLRVNCRNSPRISEFVHLLGGLEPGYLRVLRPDNHVTPRIRYYANGAKQQALLAESLSDLIDDGFAPEDIVVLSPLNETSCASVADPTTLPAPLASVRDTGWSGIGYSTVHAFKGLERAAVVLTDLAELRSDNAQSLFYTGITRATDRLVILADQRIRDDVIQAITPVGGGTG